MLTEDEALSWFKSSPGSSRIDFLCRVLRFCSPLELRYLAVVLEDVCRKDHYELQNIEHQLNNIVAFSSLAAAVDSGLSLLDKATRHKLLTALALLHSDNRSIGEKLFDVLLRSLEPNGTLKEDAIVYEEALLLLLMAANHPAFRFDHRKRLWQRIEQFTKGSTTPYEEKSESSRSSSKVTRWLETIDVTGIQKRSGQKKDFEFTMEVQWSDGSTSIVSKTYLELFDFQHKLLNAFPAEGGQANKKNRIIPFLPGRKILSTITPRELAEKRLPEIADYAQKLVELPRHVSQSSLVLEFFEAEHVDFDGTVPDALAEAWKDVVLPSKSNSLYSFADHVDNDEEEEETAAREEDGNFASADTNDNDGDGDGNEVFSLANPASSGATSAQDSYIYYNEMEDDAAKAVPLIGAPPAALYHPFYPGAPPLPPMYFPPHGGNFSFRPPPFAPHHSIPPYPYFNKLPHQQLHSNRHSYPSPQPRSNTRSPRQRQHPLVAEDDRRSSPSPTSSSGSAPTSQFRNKVTLSSAPTSSLSSPVGNRQRKSSSSSPGPKPASDAKTFFDWLKSLRLHKYYKKFGDVSFEEICQFSEDDLESLGLTEGPRRKFIKNREFLKNNPDFKGFEENGSHPSLHKSQSDLDLDSLSMSEASTSLQELRVDAATAGEEEEEESDKKKRDETAAATATTAATTIAESDPPLVSETFPYDDSDGRFGDIATQNKAVGMPPYSASLVLPPHAMYRLNEALLYPPPPLPPFHQSVYGGPPFHASFVPVQQQQQQQAQRQMQDQQGQGLRQQQQGQRPVANYIGPKEKSCFNCGEIGHVGIQCTQSKGKLSSFSMNLSSKQLDGKKS